MKLQLEQKLSHYRQKILCSVEKNTFQGLVKKRKFLMKLSQTTDENVFFYLQHPHIAAVSIMT